MNKTLTLSRVLYNRHHVGSLLSRLHQEPITPHLCVSDRARPPGATISLVADDQAVTALSPFHRGGDEDHQQESAPLSTLLPFATTPPFHLLLMCHIVKTKSLSSAVGARLGAVRCHPPFFSFPSFCGCVASSRLRGRELQGSTAGCRCRRHLVQLLPTAGTIACRREEGIVFDFSLPGGWLACAMQSEVCVCVMSSQNNQG